jgi:hypothetical protein
MDVASEGKSNSVQLFSTLVKPVGATALARGRLESKNLNAAYYFGSIVNATSRRSVVPSGPVTSYV